MKKCSKCKQELSTSEFHRRAASKDGLQHVCKECNKKAVLSKYKINKERRVRYQKEYDKKNYSKIRIRKITTNYQVGPAQAEELSLVKICAICGDVDRMKVIDHDHDTGVVRGVLCNKCNLALGGFGDSIELLEAALKYLSGSAG